MQVRFMMVCQYRVWGGLIYVSEGHTIVQIGVNSDTRIQTLGPGRDL